MKSYEEAIRGLKSVPPVDLDRQYQIIKQKAAQSQKRHLPFVPMTTAFAASAMIIILAFFLGGEMAGDDPIGNYLLSDQAVNGSEIVSYVFTD